MRHWHLALASLLVAAACATNPPSELPGRIAQTPALALPPMKTFREAPATTPARLNADMARDFMDLNFRMESGRPVARFTRFEGPVTLALAGAVPPTAPADADRLLTRLRREAGLDIRRVGDPAQANIVIEFVSRARMRARAPNAACFVVPNMASWAEYLRERRSDKTDWTLLENRTRAAVFIPSDTNPQEIRDCMHEETAQALGPLNDLYRLSDSVFNDDNFHTVLTGFDMLMLRAGYDRALSNGMSEEEVRTRIRSILDRINPSGRRGANAAPVDETPREWIKAIETTMRPEVAEEQRREAAARALSIATRRGWNDARAAFANFTYARVAMPTDPEGALIALLSARRLYERLPDAKVHVAHVDMQLAAIGLASGQPREALDLIDASLGAAERAENAALLATFLMMKAEALARLGQDARAEAVRRDSLGWARYGFGDDEYVRARLAEVSRLHPDGFAGTRPARAGETG